MNRLICRSMAMIALIAQATLANEADIRLSSKDLTRYRISGDEFLQATSDDNLAQREAAIEESFLAGHFPQFLMNFQPVTFSDGKNQLVIMVSPDYLSIGHEENFVRMPMGLDTALHIARQFNCILPTTKMVDAIYEQADIKIDAHFLPPGREMVLNSYYQNHHQWIQNQLLDDYYQDKLMAGHKKDVVLSKKLIQKSNRVAIYGWQRIKDFSPIQPLSTWHHRNYADYSHGIRLVSRIAWLNGQEQDLGQILNDSKLAQLVSDEGAFSIPAIINPIRHNFAAAGH
ncbi:MAG: hypothetical protein ACOH5I_06835 [Oligoflexus sp.]